VIADVVEGERASASREDRPVARGPVLQRLGSGAQLDMQSPAALQVCILEHAAKDLPSIAAGAIDGDADQRFSNAKLAAKLPASALSQNESIMTHKEPPAKNFQCSLLIVHDPTTRQCLVVIYSKLEFG
jgi:hypothetical protein